MREAHGVTRRVAHEHHTGHDDDGRDDRRTSHSHQFLETEVKSHGKQEEDNTDFRPGLDIRRIRYVRRQGKIGRGEEPGEDIPQYDRLVQFLEDKRPAMTRIRARSEMRGAVSDMMLLFL